MRKCYLVSCEVGERLLSTGFCYRGGQASMYEGVGGSKEREGLLSLVGGLLDETRGRSSLPPKQHHRKCQRDVFEMKK